MGIYVAAPQSLHVTQPAIGRHLKILKEWLDVQLFDRSPGGVTLTAAGMEYLSQALHVVVDAGTLLSHKAEEHRIRIV
ncbi:LysR family transcriptional regulator [Pseudomonas sp. JV449]|nr:LysR family transcriptional regulator [Pseudomonas sp. JV449]